MNQYVGRILSFWLLLRRLLSVLFGNYPIYRFVASNQAARCVASLLRFDRLDSDTALPPAAKIARRRPSCFAITRGGVRELVYSMKRARPQRDVTSFGVVARMAES